MALRSVCVFCGSAVGDDVRFAEAARDFGGRVARGGLRLVYGGGSVGLMGVLADAALSAGGTVSGVIPRTLFEREVGHRGLSELHIVETMHERKALMAQQSDAFIALPGGVGTLEELFEVWTWALLGVHGKPCALLNVAGYFDPLLVFIDRMIQQGFLLAQYRELLLVDDDAARLLERLPQFRPPPTPKWLDARMT